MTNIWGFLLQTLSVSLVAVLFLFLKKLFDDKLSPRWQYGVWSVFALRILLPVSMQRPVLLPLPLWLETLKTASEQNLASVYTKPYEPISLTHIVPVITKAPESITDWLFVLYTAGVILSLLWYLLSYIRLRWLLRQGTAASVQMQNKLRLVCETYQLKPCQIICVEGLSSAFVCGILRPILVIPAEKEPDEKILLHELLHLNYKDALQNIGWCALRSLHWCNPLLQLVFRRIENDMESLCDWRVLERLEGEERREYGNILLSMANDAFARAPGTTSISNGGKNISRRITAIVRFKKYPKGMALVSVCIALLLACPAVLGTAATYEEALLQPITKEELNLSLAMSRINRCTTVAGALDTYAKGLMQGNGIFIAAASPLSNQESLIKRIQAGAEYTNHYYYLDPGSELSYPNPSYGYQIYNLTKTAKGSYHALLVLAAARFPSETEEGYLKNEAGEVVANGYVIVPVQVYKEDGFWVVEETGSRSISTKQFYDTCYTPEYSDIPWLTETTATGSTGSITLSAKVSYHVDNTVQSSNLMGSLFGETTFDEGFKPDAEFKYAKLETCVIYNCEPDALGLYPEHQVGQQIFLLKTAKDLENADWPEDEINMTGNVSGTSSAGYSWTSLNIDANWNYSLEDIDSHYYYTLSTLPIELPYGYQLKIFWDNKVVEEFTLTLED